MTPTTYIAPQERTSPVFCRAFAQGCRGRVQTGEPLHPGPVALFGSPKLWPLFTQARTEGRTWYYADHAYFSRPRDRWFRITRNALQHDGRGPGDASRFAGFGMAIQPWRTSGTHVVVCPNSAMYFSLFGLTVGEWLRDVSAVLATHTDRPVRVRWKTQTRTRPLAADLEEAWATVVFTSNAAVESLIAGVPVFVLSDMAAAYRMGSPDLTQIETPVYPPDRLAFCEALAAHQWTLREIAQGVAWRALQEAA